MFRSNFVKTLRLRALALSSATLSLFLVACSDSRLNEEQLTTIYGETAPKIQPSVKVYHLGHSLVGRDMPAMLQQLAGTQHDYRSQLGWGATLQSHWEPNIPVNGFEEENAHDKHQEVFDAIKREEFDVFVLTEMVEIRDAIQFFDSAKYLQNFASLIHEKNPKAVLYLYESWHEVNDPQGWITRLDNDHEKYWIAGILDPAQQELNGEPTIYLIPVGQVMSAFFKALPSKKLVGNIQKPEDIFATTADGTLDPIHVNDLGEYLVALVHYAVIYQSNPIGLPYELKNADGSPAISPSKEVARLMQEITWKVVSENYRTGLTAYPGQ